MRNALRVSPSRKAREAGSGSGEAYPVPPTQAQVGHISFVVDETSFNTMADTKNHVYAVAEAENRRVVSSGRLVRVDSLTMNDALPLPDAHLDPHDTANCMGARPRVSFTPPAKLAQ